MLAAPCSEHPELLSVFEQRKKWSRTNKRLERSCLGSNQTKKAGIYGRKQQLLLVSVEAEAHLSLHKHLAQNAAAASSQLSCWWETKTSM